MPLTKRQFSVKYISREYDAIDEYDFPYNESIIILQAQTVLFSVCFAEDAKSALKIFTCTGQGVLVYCR